MYYQPIYDIRAGKFLSAEALIRLNDPEFGIIMPGLFIPAAEQRNMLGPIGEFVLEDVFRFVGSDDFQNSGLEFVEINLSVHQAIDPSLIYRVESLQNKYHVQPSQINFEVTESIYSQDHELLDYNLEKLKEMGYQLSLDDYGTGYSNINRVLSLPLSIIKFDKSLVDASDSEKGRSVLGYSILMMRNIRKAILVEGVETKEKVDQVISLGAEYIQGFYYSKPLPVPQFLEFIATHN
jgi:EAL domain-containing protein (putative c-di-GMP-specific phosphodiesterase class I)